MPRPLTELIDPGWARVLEPVAAQVALMGDFLRAETAAGRRYLPAGENVLRAFQAPFDDVRVLIVGQDPYPKPQHAIGLAFAVDKAVRPLPDSLANIYTELHDDLGITPPAHGDLSAWTDQGVMLLNRVLTVQAGVRDSHKGKGWEAITEAAIRGLAARGGPLVAILWGNPAQTLRPLLDGVPVVASPHPSPLSAYRGFFGSKPFSRANELLVEAGGTPVDWRLGGGDLDPDPTRPDA